MSRKKSQEELEREALAADEAAAKRYSRQQACGHWYAKPSEWYWSGQVRTMRCDDCGAENDIEESL